MCWLGLLPLLVTCSIGLARFDDFDNNSLTLGCSEVVTVLEKFKEYLTGIYVVTVVSFLFDTCTAYGQLKDLTSRTEATVFMNLNNVLPVTRSTISLTRIQRNASSGSQSRSRESNPTDHPNQRVGDRARRSGRSISNNSVIRAESARRENAERYLLQAGVPNGSDEGHRPVVMDVGRPLANSHPVAEIPPPLEIINIQQE